VIGFVRGVFPVMTDATAKNGKEWEEIKRAVISIYISILKNEVDDKAERRLSKRSKCKKHAVVVAVLIAKNPPFLLGSVP
jgi:transcriptional regulator of met regulon